MIHTLAQIDDAPTALRQRPQDVVCCILMLPFHAIPICPHFFDHFRVILAAPQEPLGSHEEVHMETLRCQHLASWSLARGHCLSVKNQNRLGTLTPRSDTQEDCPRGPGWHTCHSVNWRSFARISQGRD